MVLRRTHALSCPLLICLDEAPSPPPHLYHIITAYSSHCTVNFCTIRLRPATVPALAREGNFVIYTSLPCYRVGQSILAYLERVIASVWHRTFFRQVITFLTCAVSINTRSGVTNLIFSVEATPAFGV